MKITDWPASERPREKLLARGPEALSDAELLAILLRTGMAGKTVLDVARQLLLESVSLGRLLSRPVTELVSSPGLGPAKACELAVVAEPSQVSGLGEDCQSVDRPDSRNPPQQLVIVMIGQRDLRDLLDPVALPDQAPRLGNNHPEHRDRDALLRHG